MDNLEKKTIAEFESQHNNTYKGEQSLRLDRVQITKLEKISDTIGLRGVRRRRA